METFLEKTMFKRGRLALAERLGERWPNAMSLDFASQYLCMTEHEFKNDAALMSLGFQMGGKTRWSRTNLDNYIQECMEAKYETA